MVTWRFTDVGHTRTRYRETGSGEPVVLFHGGEIGAGGADTWPEEMFEILGENHRVVAVDRLGAGHTDNPETDDQYRMSAVTRHAAEFMRQLDLLDATVVGQSRGPHAAARRAKTDPDLVKRLILINSASISVRFPAEPVPGTLTYRVYNELANGDVRHDAELL